MITVGHCTFLLNQCASIVYCLCEACNQRHCHNSAFILNKAIFCLKNCFTITGRLFRTSFNSYYFNFILTSRAAICMGLIYWYKLFFKYKSTQRSEIFLLIRWSEILGEFEHHKILQLFEIGNRHWNNISESNLSPNVVVVDGLGLVI